MAVFKISHPRKDFVINQSTFTTKQEAELHMNTIKKFAREWVLGGYYTQLQADKYIAKFKIKEVK